MIDTTPAHAIRTTGSAQPLSGVSGAMRRAAYARPEHDSLRWLTLLMADRADVAGTLAKQPWTVPRHYIRQARAFPLGTALTVGAMAAIAWVSLMRKGGARGGNALAKALR
jgi:hypothetical protein